MHFSPSTSITLRTKNITALFCSGEQCKCIQSAMILSFDDKRRVTNGPQKLSMAARATVCDSMRSAPCKPALCFVASLENTNVTDGPVASAPYMVLWSGQTEGCAPVLG